MKHRRRPTHYNVRPRYGCGSPAQVGQRIAEGVVTSEMRSYQDAIDGIYGEGLQQRARRLGLRGIAEGVRESRKGWEITDLITGEHFIRPFDDRMRKDGWHQWNDLSPGIQEKIAEVEPVVAKEAEKDSRILWFRGVDLPDFWAFEKGRHTPTTPKKLIWEPEIEEPLS